MAAPVPLRAMLSVHRRGAGDPAYRVAPDGSVWRAVHTPDGPGTVTLAQASGGTVTARAWGAGAAWLIQHAPDLVGEFDDPSELVVHDDAVARLVARVPHLRLGRTDRVWEALVAAVMEQKVVGTEAYRAWRYLLTRYGDRAPGPVPGDMRVPPPQARWREITEADWHRSGLEAVRARTIRAAATVDVENRADRLTRLRGVGPWTAAHTRIRALGDPDAVPIGDYHTPAVVGTAMIGRAVDDDGMLELLEPYAGQRYRVIRLCELGGGMPERRGPRMSVRDYRDF
ncbi:3-methyladenine DNA glycosylase [Gordonia sp. (in: high G+C Gram-positive bacteria)]|uniref:DNA-3-methyladenine glycosylase family protein n=1 Tax=Gordonia sp. (in: high G+C Gram-positive bacteria) TaxID=84139 RepID=UPI001698298B|nr:3-methyladenine DNA glycosylase [Gordonia sp. (in: high G+C Gram-positive bacteria)]NLG45210.1 3-methyladenine DNA glycosylase [Gordonia sp. (in: high G+C Gram-positive bacteria)]